MQWLRVVQQATAAQHNDATTSRQLLFQFEAVSSAIQHASAMLYLKLFWVTVAAMKRVEHRADEVVTLWVAMDEVLAML